MPDHSLPFREAVIVHLRADEFVAAVLGGRVYEKMPKDVAIWPYARYRADDATPFELTGSKGAEIAFTLHVFAHGPETDAVHRINEALRHALDDETLPIEEGYTVSIDWVRTQIVADESPNDHHGLVEFIARTGS